MSERDYKAESAGDRDVPVSRRLSFRWKVLQGLGAVLVALAVMIYWPTASDPTLPSTRSFLLMLGACVFVAGLLAERRRDVGA